MREGHAREGRPDDCAGDEETYDEACAFCRAERDDDAQQGFVSIAWFADGSATLNMHGEALDVECSVELKPRALTRLRGVLRGSGSAQLLSLFAGVLQAGLTAAEETDEEETDASPFDALDGVIPPEMLDAMRRAAAAQTGFDEALRSVASPRHEQEEPPT